MNDERWKITHEEKVSNYIIRDESGRVVFSGNTIAAISYLSFTLQEIRRLKEEIRELQAESKEKED